MGEEPHNFTGSGREFGSCFCWVAALTVPFVGRMGGITQNATTPVKKHVFSDFGTFDAWKRAYVSGEQILVDCSIWMNIWFLLFDWILKYPLWFKSWPFFGMVSSGTFFSRWPFSNVWGNEKVTAGYNGGPGSSCFHLSSLWFSFYNQLFAKHPSYLKMLRMYGIVTYIRLKFSVNVGWYSIRSEHSGCVSSHKLWLSGKWYHFGDSPFFHGGRWRNSSLDFSKSIATPMKLCCGCFCPNFHSSNFHGKLRMQ